MARYRIKSYKKIKQSFLASINSMDETTGGIKEPYDITLDKFSFFGLVHNVVTKRVMLPKGFNHQKELISGREWKN